MKKALEVWSRVRGPLLRFVFIQLMLFLSVHGLNTFNPPIWLFLVVCTSMGYVYGKVLMPWVTEEHDKKLAAMMEEAHSRLAELELLIQQQEQANMQEMLQNVIQLNPKKKPEAPN